MFPAVKHELLHFTIIIISFKALKFSLYNENKTVANSPSAST